MLLEASPLEKRTIPNLWAAAVEKDPDASFLLFDGDEWSYGEADRFVAATARRLYDEGLAPGSHVAVFLDNGPEYVWTLLALARIGAVAVPIHGEAQGPLLRHFLLSSDCRSAIIADGYLGRVSEAIGAEVIERVWVVTTEAGADQAGLAISAHQTALTFTDSIAVDAGAEPIPEPRFSDTALLMFTSGTSGPSKAAIVAQAHPMTAALAMADAAGISAADRMHTCLPLSHANAMWFTVYTAITVGASVALSRRFSVSGFWRDVVATGSTQTSLLGSMLQLLWKREPDADEQNARLQSMFVVPFPTNAQSYEDRFGAKLMTIYGMSEWTPVSLSRPGEGYDKPTGMAGPLRWDLNDIAILDDDDLPLPTGRIGEIAVRRKQPFTSFQGYYGRDAETLGDWRNLWFHTGDHGYIGEDDYLYFVGRKSDSLRRRGENVSAGELEDILLECPLIAEVAAVAVPSDLGEISEDDIAVFVIPTATEADPAAIRQFAVDHLPRYMRPRYLKFVDDFPRTGNAKVRKQPLREEAKAALADFHDFDREQVR
ncbi:MAG: AMP-binding protein [Actinobacteria bacterium]|nr:AMP-binding protein [Actinomycetota bacterium]